MLLTFLEVAAHLLKYLIQVSVTCVDSTLKAELWETGSYNRYVKESESTDTVSGIRCNNPELYLADKLYL